MKRSQLLVAGCVAVLANTGAWGQFVKGNEAVTVLPDGKKQVVTPPLPKASLAAPCPADRAGCAGSGWRMVETAEGLRECTEAYARQGTCRTSTYGTQKLSRLWIVKKGAQWKQCQLPDLSSTCVNLGALPFSAVQ